MERGRGHGRWQVGPGVKRFTYRFATSARPRGGREVDLGRSGLKERAQCLWVSLDFSKRKMQQKKKTFEGIFVRNKKYTKICVGLRTIFLIL